MSSGVSAKKGETGKRSNILLSILAIAVLIGVAFASGQYYFGSFTESAGSSGATTTTGEVGATIGGPFKLIDQHGNVVTDVDFRGKYMLVFFGYTFCPDVCPTGLARNSEALELLGEKGDNIVPIFISVDPERDTVELLKNFADFFHPRLVALTGEKDMITEVAKAYRVYYAKVVEPDNKDDEMYLIDHSAITYLMGPDGKYIRHFGHNLSAERMAELLRESL
ncbi:MAG: SCO family protein [Rhodospirillales bacterium]|nr:SCO family protein [Rhodospirillales bacterium]